MDALTNDEFSWRDRRRKSRKRSQKLMEFGSGLGTYQAIAGGLGRAKGDNGVFLLEALYGGFGEEPKIAGV